jgi:CubicO group peptidase (beta-lactamase class C family)
LLCVAAAAQEPAWATAATEAIEACVLREHVPGLSCAIAVGGEMPFRRGFGLADVENDTPATPQTVGREDGRLVVSHSGAQSRVSTMLYVLPEQQVAVAVLCNLEHARVQELGKQLAALAAPKAAK